MSFSIHRLDRETLDKAHEFHSGSRRSRHRVHAWDIGFFVTRIKLKGLILRFAEYYCCRRDNSTGRDQRSPSALPLLRRAHDHYRDVRTRHNTALSSANRRHRQLMMHHAMSANTQIVTINSWTTPGHDAAWLLGVNCAWPACRPTAHKPLSCIVTPSCRHPEHPATTAGDLRARRPDIRAQLKSP